MVVDGRELHRVLEVEEDEHMDQAVHPFDLKYVNAMKKITKIYHLLPRRIETSRRSSRWWSHVWRITARLQHWWSTLIWLKFFKNKIRYVKGKIFYQEHRLYVYKLLQ